MFKKAMGNYPVGWFPISHTTALADVSDRRLLCRSLQILIYLRRWSAVVQSMWQAQHFVFSGTGKIIANFVTRTHSLCFSALATLFFSEF